MRIFSLLMASIVAFAAPASSAETDTRVFEMRTYFAPEGKLDELHARFRDHTTRLFEKHGMTNLGYWVPIENPERKLIYVLAYPSREARQKSWAAFGADQEWKTAKAASETNGTLVSKVEELYLQPTNYSPAIAPAVGKSERVFELRTYTTTPGNLAALDARFREHTMSLFAKHGMTNLFYWHPTADQPRADSTLLYFLAHDSVEAAKKSFEAFRADPDWISARKASEEKAGGSLTIPDGVQSLFLKATDYSPTR